jgi:hypothetical protein
MQLKAMSKTNISENIAKLLNEFGLGTGESKPKLVVRYRFESLLVSCRSLESVLLTCYCNQIAQEH